MNRAGGNRPPGAGGRDLPQPTILRSRALDHRLRLRALLTSSQLSWQANASTMLRISSLSLSRGVKLLLHDASLTVHPGHKVGLIGANGSGKSSVFALLRGELSQDQGELSTPPGWVIAQVAQETAPVAGSAIDYVLDGDGELRGVESALAAAQADEAADTHASGEHLAELHHR